MQKLLDTIKSRPILFPMLFIVFALSVGIFFEVSKERVSDSDRIQISTVTPLSQGQTETLPSKEEGIKGSLPDDDVDVTSLKLYGSRIGMQDAVNIDTSSWKTENNKESEFSFKYPSGAKVLNEGNCYRVEYKQGFVIFLLPLDGDMRCGARTGVGNLPDNIDVTDKLLIQGKEYLAPGFRAVVDTKGEEFYKPETRYFYDFHHMFDVDYCFKKCLKIGYGIYKESPVPLQKVDVDKTMDSLRAIIESLKYQK